MLGVKSIGGYVVVCLCVLVVGCSGIKSHEYHPLAQGIFNVVPESAPSSTIVWSNGQRLAVVMSKNTKLSIENQEEVVKIKDKMAGSMFFESDFQLAQREANDPRFEIGYVSSVLKESFGQVSLVGRVDDFLRGGFDGLVVVDIYRTTRNGLFSFEEKFILNTAFFDDQLRHINTVSSEVVESIPHAGSGGGSDSYTIRVREVVRKGLVTWEERLKNAIQYR